MVTPGDESGVPVSIPDAREGWQYRVEPGQRALAAARAEDLYAEQARERQKRKPKSVVEDLPPQEKGKARDKAGEAFGVSGKSDELLVGER